MTPRTSRTLALGCVLALFTSSCTQLSTQENTGVFAGGNAQLAAGGINRAGTAASGGLLATGAPVSATTTAVVTIIAKHQASVRQRQVAEERARATYARLVAQRADVPEKEMKPARKQAKSGGKKQAATTAAPPSSKVANIYRKPKAKKIPRYLAVETEKDSQTAPGAKKAVMIWDTETQEIVGNNVYDVASTPPVGATSRFEIFSAEYVGAGL